MSYASLGNSTLFAIFLKWPIITAVVGAGVLVATNNVDPALSAIQSLRAPTQQVQPIKPITQPTKATA